MLEQCNTCKIRQELAKRNQMLMDAHFQNKKLADKLIEAEEKINKLQKLYNDLEEMYDCTK